MEVNTKEEVDANGCLSFRYNGRTIYKWKVLLFYNNFFLSNLTFFYIYYKIKANIRGSFDIHRLPPRCTYKVLIL